MYFYRCFPGTSQKSVPLLGMPVTRLCLSPKSVIICLAVLYVISFLYLVDYFRNPPVNKHAVSNHDLKSGRNTELEQGHNMPSRLGTFSSHIHAKAENNNGVLNNRPESQDKLLNSTNMNNVQKIKGSVTHLSASQGEIHLQ